MPFCLSARSLAAARFAPLLLATLATRALPAQVATWELRQFASLQHLEPTKPDRRIRTLTADIGVARVLSPRLDVHVSFAFTATVARGRIVQLDSALQASRLDGSAIGLGPAVQFRARPVALGPVRLGAEVSAGLLWYSSGFPPGGDRYNGMLRLGPAASVQIGARHALTVTGHWMHASNGQGLVPRNPSYEAKGLTIGIERAVSHAVRDDASARRRRATAALIGAVAGAAGGALLSRHEAAGGTRVSPGITLAGGLVGLVAGVAWRAAHDGTVLPVRPAP